MSSSSTMITDGGSHDLRSYLDVLQHDAAAGKLTTTSASPIIVKILSHRNIFCGFDQVKAVICDGRSNGSGSLENSPEFSKICATLDLFSFGTLRDYHSAQPDNDKFLTLNDHARTKLAQLTVMTSVQNASGRGLMSITYKALAEALGWDDDGDDPASVATTSRRVVDCLVKCLYADVLRGKLCQRTKTFSWEGQALPVVCPRDVPPSQISTMLETLKGLEQRLAVSIDELRQNEGVVLKNLEQDAKYWHAIQDRCKNARSEGDAKSFSSMNVGVGGPRGAGAGPVFGAGSQFPSGRQTGAGSVGGPRSSKRSRGVVETAFRM